VVVTRRFATPAAFKMSLEQRLRNRRDKTDRPVNRLRQLLVLERFIVRVDRAFGDDAVLKGGLAIELRVGNARTTRDADFRFSGHIDDLLGRLQEVGQADLGDYMSFEIAPAPTPRTAPRVHGDGKRFRVQCLLAGAQYGAPFGCDVAFGDVIVGEPDVVEGTDVLAFAGIAPPKVRVYPITSQVAEKLHAYTLRRERENTRIKDLPDLAVLATIATCSPATLRKAIETTFENRGTHAVPGSVPAPPDTWRGRYQQLVEEEALRWRTLGEVHSAVAGFLDPVLRGLEHGAWEPGAWGWRS
jgi:hypothetical protein